MNSVGVQPMPARAIRAASAGTCAVRDIEPPVIARLLLYTTLRPSGTPPVAGGDESNGRIAARDPTSQQLCAARAISAALGALARSLDERGGAAIAPMLARRRACSSPRPREPAQLPVYTPTVAGAMPWPKKATSIRRGDCEASSWMSRIGLLARSQPRAGPDQ